MRQWLELFIVRQAERVLRGARFWLGWLIGRSSQLTRWLVPRPSITAFVVPLAPVSVLQGPTAGDRYCRLRFRGAQNKSASNPQSKASCDPISIYLVSCGELKKRCGWWECPAGR